MSDENIPDESKPIRKRSSGFINKISRWIPESWTGRIVAGTLIASIAFWYSFNTSLFFRARISVEYVVLPASLGITFMP